jgi:UDP-N-acetylmuramoylalanine--D-glutamate ligase
MNIRKNQNLGLDVKGKRVAVIGFGRSGRSAARLLSELGASVAVADEKSQSELTELKESKTGHVEVYGGGEYNRALHGAELVVISPGVPTSLPPIREARAAGIPLIGEMELAFRSMRDMPAKWLGITGTNGKSTTVTLLGELLHRAGFSPFVGGNLGTPLTEAALAWLQGRGRDFIVAEVSSFQLETIETFRPWAGAILNLTPDHLDRYPSMEEYAAAKARLFENQNKEDFAVLNADDPGLNQYPPALRGSLVQFSHTRSLKRGVFIREGVMVSSLTRKLEDIIPIGELRLQGLHNLENAMAAGAVALLAGCPAETIAGVLRDFKGLEHVMEIVRVLRGVTYINDSKGTNVDAVVKALESLKAPVILIAGGREKGGEYAGLAQAVRNKVKQVILLGEARSHLRQVLNGTCPVTEVANLADAVREAVTAAHAGDTVLLSPACASFDMFRDYKDRGRLFKEYVNELA